MGRFSLTMLTRASDETLEALLDDESLSEQEYSMVKEVADRRQTGEYMAESVFGADGSDEDETKRYDFDPRAMVAGYGLIDGFQIESTDL